MTQYCSHCNQQLHQDLALTMSCNSRPFHTVAFLYSIVCSLLSRT